MLLRHICRVKAAEKLEKAMEVCPVTITGSKDGATAADYADALIELL